MNIDYYARAKALPYSVKKTQIGKYYGKEAKFHDELKIALQNAYQNAYIEILQGTSEKGKDLVKRQVDEIGKVDTTAYVVKLVDKLNGSATGKTAEIFTQVSQSFKIKAQLSDFAEPIAINKVVVVLGGTISDSAKTNILTMLDNDIYRNNVSFIDMAGLIHLFEVHYPEFYFSDELRRLFKDRIEMIERFLIEDKELKDFIEPNIKKFSRTKQEMIAATSGGRDDLKKIAEQIFGKKENFHEFLELVTVPNGRNILLSGDAGSGKSVLVHKLLLTFLNKYLSENPTQENISKLVLPVCLRATDLTLENLSNFEDIIETFYLSDKKKRSQCNYYRWHR